jgi:diguanylate cyclase (GGDEF)-like protein
VHKVQYEPAIGMFAWPWSMDWALYVMEEYRLAGVVVLESGVENLGASGQTDLIDQTIAHGFPLLSFPKPLEARFVAACEAKRFLMIVVAGLGGILLLGGLLIADFLLTPKVLPLAVVLRLGVFPPLVVLALVMARKLRRPVLTEWLVAAAGLVAALIECTLLMTGDQPWAVVRVVELNIVVVYICAIARFWPAVTLAAAVALVHSYAVMTMPDPSGVIVPNASLLLATATGFLLYGNYKLEHDERMAFLQAAREQAFHAELSVAHERLTQMATTDVLTQVANRRYFEGFLDECWVRAQTQRRYLSLLVLDIDFFKPYNDLYGHQAGDLCLVAVAQAIKDCIRRPSDLLARWGGEEFVVVMMDADADAATAASERIRHAVQALALAHGASKCSPVVTISGGRATLLPDMASSASRLVELADRALYRAKSSGRNRVCAGYEALAKSPAFAEPAPMPNQSS